MTLRRGVVQDDVDALVQTTFMEANLDLCEPEPPDFHQRSSGLSGAEGGVAGGEIAPAPQGACLGSCGHLATGRPDRPFEAHQESEWERNVLEDAMAQVVEKPWNPMEFQALAIERIRVEQVCAFGMSGTNADMIKARAKDKLEPIVRMVEEGTV